MRLDHKTTRLNNPEDHNIKICQCADLLHSLSDFKVGWWIVCNEFKKALPC
jgi:hypothetical protein